MAKDGVVWFLSSLIEMPVWCLPARENEKRKKADPQFEHTHMT